MHISISFATVYPGEMEGVISKLRFKGQSRILVINASDYYLNMFKEWLPDVRVDTCIDQRFLYEFVVVFSANSADVKRLAPPVLHNLAADGVLWFVYPKKAGIYAKTDVDRDHGWEPLQEKGFRRVSQVSVDDSLSALRFRNESYVRSAKKD
jgi:hypothetical protein